MEWIILTKIEIIFGKRPRWEQFVDIPTTPSSITPQKHQARGFKEQLIWMFPKSWGYPQSIQVISQWLCIEIHGDLGIPHFRKPLHLGIRLYPTKSYYITIFDGYIIPLNHHFSWIQDTSWCLRSIPPTDASCPALQRCREAQLLAMEELNSWDRQPRTAP